MTSLQKLAERLMRCPAAPYHESQVAREIEQICEENDLPFRLDSYGNLLVSLARTNRTPPLILAAHMDHPGFVVRRKATGKEGPGFEAEFLGGVGDQYFQPGTPLRLFPGGAPALLGTRQSKARRIFNLSAPSPSQERPQFAVWDLPDFEVQNGTIVGRACDDLIGAATILHVLIHLRASRARVNVVGALTRAEEVGFHGALALAQSGQLPRESLLISLETSRELPPVVMGKGVIIQVGDRASTFDSASTRFLAEVASDLAKRKKEFQFQRALMSGGTCEATAYQEYGYRCAAVCVALGNYHNCGSDNRIAAEYVNLADAEAMSTLLQRSATEMKQFSRLVGRLPKRLEGLSKEAVQKLKRPRSKADEHHRG